MKGLIAEALSMMEEGADPEVMDANLIGCARKVEHYEIATYGTLCTWAKQLGYGRTLKLLKQNMSEEGATDESFTELSQAVNAEANA